MDADDIRKLIYKFGDGINAIVGKIESDASLNISKDEAFFCIEAYAEVLKSYKMITGSQKVVVDNKFRELFERHGALDLYSDKSVAIYARDGLTAFNELLKPKA